MTGDRTPIAFLQTQHNEWAASFSPDDKWIAYTSDKTGRAEVYVRSFPKGDKETKISQNGGGSARWRRDGKEIFFLSLDVAMMSVPIDTTKGFTPGALQRLFPTRQIGFDDQRQYAVANDGQRFLIPIPGPPVPITVLLNWPAKVAK